MAESFLALIGPATRGAQPRAVPARMVSTKMMRHDCGDDLIIWAAPGLTVTRKPSCVIVGQIVARTSTLPVVWSDPNDLLRKCWGNYVAFGLDASGSQVSWILRGPLGHLPVFRAAVGASTILASDAGLLTDTIDAKIQIDWTFVSEHLACQHLQTARTGLLGIDEILGGEILRHVTSGHWERAPVWTPWAFTMIDSEIRCATVAEEALRDSINDVVAGLTRSAGSCLLELSGGLDSSILAAALVAAGAPARAITFVTQSAEGDERAYAHTAASSVGMPLEELRVGADVDLARAAPVRAARPGLPMVLTPADLILAEKAHSDGIAMFVSGAGGDCVFCSPASAAPAADVIRRFGFGQQAWQAIDALARIHHANVWTVARMAWRQARSGPRDARWPVTPGLLASDCVPLSPPDHPWFNEPEDILPGKRSHVRAILAALAHVDGFSRHAVAPSRFPLLSQPVVETALSIPSWLWIAQGRDRAVARDAWRGHLPAKILDRRTKGGLDGYAIEALATNRVRLTPFLLEGHLARHGLIDRARVEKALHLPVRRGDAAPYLLLPLMDTEAWVRAWLGDP